MSPGPYFAFEFGWGKLFAFTFRIGEPTTRSTKRAAEKTSDSQQSLKWLSETTNPTKIKPQHPRPDPATAIKDCLLFSMLPLEVRRLIYKHLLVSTDVITKSHNLISWSQSPLMNDRARILDIDAVLIRTCRQIYNETMPILYGENIFIFERADEVSAFRDHGRLGGTFLSCESILTLQGQSDSYP